MRIMIRGVGYETNTAEFDVYSTLSKNVSSSFVYGFNGTFHFSNGTTGELFMFINRKGLKMIRVHGKFVGLAHELESYLINRRADVTKFTSSILK